MGKRILVVTTAPVPGESLRDRVRAEAGAEDAEVKVVAPVADLSPLDWLANDEDEARGVAAERAKEAKTVLEPDADSVEAEVGDTDPVQAIEDALREFPADELMLVRNAQPLVARFGGALGTLLAGADMWLRTLRIRLPFRTA